MDLGLDAPLAGEPSSLQAHTSNRSSATENASPDFHHSTDQPGPQQAQQTPLSSEPSSCRTRARRPPAHLGDYICYNTRCKEPLSLAARLQNESSSTSYPIANYVVCTNFSVTHKQFLTAVTKVIESRYYHEAAKDPRWRDAMADEIRALEQNGTWILQDLLAGKKPISCKCVIVSNIILMDPFCGIRLDW